MSVNRFRTKNGRLTWYALACGYIDVYEKNNIRTTLWHEGACYHVRSTNFNTVTRLSWDTAQTVGEAYRIFAQHKRMFHKSVRS